MTEEQERRQVETDELRWRVQAPIPCPNCGSHDGGPWHEQDGTPSGHWWCPECREFHRAPEDATVEVVLAARFDEAMAEVVALRRAITDHCPEQQAGEIMAQAASPTQPESPPKTDPVSDSGDVAK